MSSEPDAPLPWSDVAGDPAHPVVVLVHGSMDRAAGLARLARRLAGEFRVVRYDRRGYGRSVALGGPFGVARHVDDLADVLDRMAPGRTAALVFGHSFGGNVALGLAEHRPDLVRAVAVYEAPLSWLDWWPADTAGGSALRSADPAAAAEAFMRRLLGDRRWERLPAATRTARLAEGSAMVGELADLRERQPWDGTQIGLPVLVLVGERSSDHQRRAGEALPAMIADCTVEVVPGAGHVGPNTNATDVGRRLARFAAAGTSPSGLRSIPSAASPPAEQEAQG